MLKAVRKGEELDEIKLKHFLFAQSLIQSTDSPIDIQQFSNGYSNLTYLLSIEGKEIVLRRPPKGAVKRGHDMSREYKVLSHLQNGFEKSPATLAYTEDTDIIGASFYLMEKVDGIILNFKEAKTRNIDATGFKKISDQWLKLFVELHQLDYKKVGLADLGKPEGYVERQVRNWGKQYIKAATSEIPEAEKLMKWMEENQPKEYEHTFIHNDFKYDNVVFKDDSWSEIVAILDWEMCTLGDPLMDLGTSIAYWMTPADGPLAKIIPTPTLMDGNPTRSKIVEQYAQLSGRNIDHIVFYYVYGLFKISVIVQQIFYRYKMGLTQDEKFAQLDKACIGFCKMGWQAVQKNKIENLF